jgi:hypothetical protein
VPRIVEPDGGRRRNPAVHAQTGASAVTIRTRGGM